MKRFIFLMSLLLCWCSFSARQLQAQPPKTVQVQVQGNIVEPAKIEPTEERIAGLKLPSGFRIQRFAHLSNPRMIAVAPDGTVYISQREPGTLVMLKDTDHDGAADVQKVIAEKKMAHGVTIHNGRLYLTTVKEIYAADIKPDGTVGTWQTLIGNLPDGGQHPNRTIAFGPDGNLYITVGSTCNDCKDTNDENATILRATADGKSRTIFASGLRNTIGFGWHPTSRRLFGFDHGIDWLGDNEQGEEVNEIIEGSRYGWPFVYGKSQIYPHGEPPKGYSKEAWAKMSREPLVLYTPHSAPMQMVFYTGAQFPAEYRNDAFVAMRGSWNRNPPSGYEVVRVRFDKGGAPQGVEPFITGFLVRGGSPQGGDAYLGRLAGLAQMPDGSLLLSDDANGIVYRISYAQGAAQNQASNLFPAQITSTLPEMIKAADEGGSAGGSIKITSESFANYGAISDKHSNYFDDQSPALRWSGAPQNAQSLVLMLEDPDAASPKPFVHWIVANLSPQTDKLPAGILKGDGIPGIEGAMQGANNMSTIGYYGPRPPAGDPAHHYHFQVFALDRKLDLQPGFNRQWLLSAMRGHVLAKGDLVGTYQRELKDQIKQGTQTVTMPK